MWRTIQVTAMNALLFLNSDFSSIHHELHTFDGHGTCITPIVPSNFTNEYRRFGINKNKTRLSAVPPGSALKERKMIPIKKEKLKRDAGP